MGEKSFGKGSVQTVVQTGSGMRRCASPRRVTTRRRVARFRPAASSRTSPFHSLSDPDYKDRRVVREADLRRHLLAQAKVEEDKAAGGRRHAGSALRREAGGTGEEGHQGLPALLCTEHAEAACGTDRAHERRVDDAAGKKLH